MQINREGSVVFGDFSLRVWEEGISAARAAGGWNGAQAWERQFKHDVFKRIIQQLRRIGWTVGPWDDAAQYNSKSFASSHRTISKGEHLHGLLDVSGRCIKLEMWQSANTPTRPDHNGRYEWDKEKVAPYLIRLEMERTRRKIRDYLCAVFSGYTFEDGCRAEIGPGFGQITATEAASISRRTSGHYVPELDRAQFNGDAGTSGDGLPLENGTRVYAMGRDGRIVTGIAYYCLNGNWTIVTGRYGILYNVWHKQIWVNSPGDLRRKRNDHIRRSRLERELNKAVAAMDFRRAEVIKSVLFPTNEPLFMVWHKEHGAYHCAGFSGYTSNASQAGKFTRAEIGGYDNDRNEIRALSAA